MKYAIRCILPHVTEEHDVRNDKLRHFCNFLNFRIQISALMNLVERIYRVSFSLHGLFLDVLSAGRILILVLTAWRMITRTNVGL